MTWFRRRPRALLLTLLTTVALSAGCGAPTGERLAYRLAPGEAYYYEVYEWLDTRPGPQTPTGALFPQSLEVGYSLTATVAKVDRTQVSLDVTVSLARAQVIDAQGARDWQSASPQSATLILRPGTGERRR